MQVFDASSMIYAWDNYPIRQFVNDRYHAKGVGENDILIIATARADRAELVSDEGRQNVQLNEPAKRKIPAVCSMKEVALPCMNFIEYIKRADVIFR